MYKKGIAILVTLALGMSFMMGTETKAANMAGRPDIEVFYSSYNDLDLQYTLSNLTDEKNLYFQESFQSPGDGAAPIVVDPSVTYQTWQGFGGSLDGASIYHLNKLSDSDYEDALTDLVDADEGNGYNWMRLSIGCSDFTPDAIEAGDYGPYGENAGSGYWTYDDTPDEDINGDGIGDVDMDLSGFSIGRDADAGIISTLQDILAINPHVRFLASMWSAPAWMKKNESIIWQNGQCDPELKEGCYEVLAEYYCRFIEEYENNGIHIDAVTLQNEPDIKIGYPCMFFTPENQIRFANCLGQAFVSHGITTKIWGMDANEFETWNYAVPLLQSEASEYVDGIGFHNYGGIPMYYPNTLKNVFKDKTWNITEMTVGANKLVEYMRNNINSYLYWVTYYSLDMDGHTYGPGPSFWSKPQSDDADHWSLSQLSDDGAGGYRKNAKYYVFGQFSRFINAGSVRIASSENDGYISNVAFSNPDGSISLVVVNRIPVQNTNSDPDTPDRQIQVMTPDGMFTDVIPGDTVATYRWYPTTGKALSKSGMTISASDTYSGYEPAQAVDDLPKTLWLSGCDQYAGQQVTLSFDSTRYVSQLSLFSDRDFLDDYPAGIKVETSVDGNNWLERSISNGTPGVTNISLGGRVEAKYIKLTLTSGKNKWWSIGEIALFDSQNSTDPAQLSSQVITDKSGWGVQASSGRFIEEYSDRSGWFSVSEIHGWNDAGSEMFDGDQNTRWTSGKAQESGDSVNIDLGTLTLFDKIELDCGSDNGISFRVLASQNGISYSEIGTFYGNAGTTVIRFDNLQTAKCLRFELTEGRNDAWWSIYELRLSHPQNMGLIDGVPTWISGVSLEGQAIDGDLNTFWRSAENQTKSDGYTTSYLLNLGYSRQVSGVSINSGSEMWTCLDEYEVYVWNDGEEAKLVAKGRGSISVTDIRFARTDAKYIWIKAGRNSDRPFVIAELNVFR
ncbi:MAG: discoidin domain-containing protein [Acetatifactor sp.]|nr:discoidin domain-containing protein [Acetatifactor sp.]